MGQISYAETSVINGHHMLCSIAGELRTQVGGIYELNVYDISVQLKLAARKCET
jgi:hypothetical protein